MVVEEEVMSHLRSQPMGQKSTSKSPRVTVEGAQQSVKNVVYPIMTLEPSTSALKKYPVPVKPSMNLQRIDEGGEKKLDSPLKKYSVPVKPSMNLQHIEGGEKKLESPLKKYSVPVKPSMSLQRIDEGGEKRLEAAFKSVLGYSFRTGTPEVLENENVTDSGKTADIVNATTSVPKSESKDGKKSKADRKMKFSCPKGCDGLTFTLCSESQPDATDCSLVHRCRSCSVPCHDFFGEFCGFPNADANMDTSVAVVVDDLSGSCHGSDFADESDEFYGFESVQNDQNFSSYVEVTALKPCSVVLYRLKPCSVVLHRLKYSFETGNTRQRKNVSPYRWQFPTMNGTLPRRPSKKRLGSSRRAKKKGVVVIKQEPEEDVDVAELAFLDKNNGLFKPINSLSVTVWDQFQEACNLSLQKEFVDDFCGFSPLDIPH